jgi:polar amino acid transport system substrate-binding protein
MYGELDSPLRLVADPYPPYQYTADGEVTGIDHKFISDAFEAVGLRTSTRLLAWSLCLQAMREGVADAIFQITPTRERVEWLRFSLPFRSARTLLYQLADEITDDLKDVRLNAMATEHRIGVLDGFSYGTVIDDLPGKFEAPSNAALLLALRNHDIAFAVMDEGVAQHLLGGDRDISPVAGFCATRPMHLACRRDAPEIVLAFNAGLETITGKVTRYGAAR